MFEFISRLKAPVDDEQELTFVDKNNVLISTNPPDVVYKKDKEYQKYAFDKIIQSNISQSIFYSENVRPLVQQLLNEKNSTIFFFGVMDSGKMYSLIGNSEDNLDRLGVLQRCCLDILLNLNFRTKSIIYKST